MHHPVIFARRLRRAKALAISLAWLLLAACTSTSVDTAGRRFDADKAWAEFVELLSLDYAYFERPGVNGPAILAHFAPQARAAKSAGEFIAVTKTVARNFADPHFNVGPGIPSDPSLVPTASDLYGSFSDGRFVIRDVRAGSDALAQGVVPGAEVVAIDGRSPAAAIEALLGQPLSALSPAQASHGLNIALAGVHGRSRQLVTRSGDVERTHALKPALEQARALEAAPALDVERRGTLGIVRFNNSLGRNDALAALRDALEALRDTQALIIDLRNTPSGGNTTVARGIMGHFVSREMPYQVHVVPGEERRYGVPRKFIEYVLPVAPHYRGRVFVLGGRWTSSMGEGLMIGFDALGIATAGSPHAHLLGAMFNETLATSQARVDIGEEQLLHVNGTPREAFVPSIAVEPAEATRSGDPTIEAVLRVLARKQ